VSWAIWITGPPAAGKTSLARAFVEEVARGGVRPVHLESDALRRVLTPAPTFAPEERDRFYDQVRGLAALLVEQGIPVVVDATGPRRRHRDPLRSRLARFFEVSVSAPRELREARDPKGLYRLAREGGAPHLPGATDDYEPPLLPDLVVSGALPAQDGAEALVAFARERGLI
jgi:adenylylsulfate kinase